MACFHDVAIVSVNTCPIWSPCSPNLNRLSHLSSPIIWFICNCHRLFPLKYLLAFFCMLRGPTSCPFSFENVTFMFLYRCSDIGAMHRNATGQCGLVILPWDGWGCNNGRFHLICKGTPLGGHPYWRPEKLPTCNDILQFLLILTQFCQIKYAKKCLNILFLT